MLRIFEGGSLIGFYFILVLLILLLAARALEGLGQIIKNRREPLLKDIAVILDREVLPGGLIVKVTFATLHYGSFSLELTGKEAGLFKEARRGTLVWQGKEYRSFVPDRS